MATTNLVGSKESDLAAAVTELFEALNQAPPELRGENSWSVQVAGYEFTLVANGRLVQVTTQERKSIPESVFDVFWKLDYSLGNSREASESVAPDIRSRGVFHPRFRWQVWRLYYAEGAVFAEGPSWL